LSQPIRSPSLEYRAEIDGLRAIAVLSVLGFHFGGTLRGGFIGVDVFFVISGFLITRIIAAEVAVGDFSFVGFYDRRVRRIFPALLVMLGVTVSAGAFLLYPEDYANLGSSAASATFGLSNFYFLHHTGYFDQEADLMPLLHTWSLAVEEQFYVVWPMIFAVFATGRSRASNLFWILCFTATICAASIVYFRIDPKAAFFLAPPRAWELSLGAALVFAKPLPARLGSAASSIGLAILAVGFLKVSPSKFPGVSALLPCLGAALVIWPKEARGSVDRYLGLLAPIGLISYSLYLWHWPIWVYYRTYLNNGKPSVLEIIVLTVASLTVAFLSYRFVERPFRSSRWKPARSVAVGCICALVVLTASAAVKLADGFPRRLPVEANSMISRDAMWAWPHCERASVSGLTADCVFGAPWATAARKTVIWGDSHAEHLAPLVFAARSDPGRAYLVHAGCPPVLGDGLSIDWADGIKHSEHCERGRSRGVQILNSDPKINEVILSSYWPELPARIGRGNFEAGYANMQSELTKLLHEVSRPDRAIILVGSVPQMPLTAIECARNRSSGLLRAPCTYELDAKTASASLDEAKPTDAMFANLSQALPNVKAISASESLCSKKGCDNVLNGEFLYRDRGHIRRNLQLETQKLLADRIGLTEVMARPGTAGAPFSHDER
jgi:peptidoglycan/LPS O-acetylase OafA/YrhL